MASSMVLKVAFMCVVMWLAISAPQEAEGAITCGSVTATLAPCITYLQKPGATVPPACCTGVKNLNNQAKTTPDRQAACECIKKTVKSISNLNLPTLAALPGKCGVNLPYKISPSIDCKT